MNEPYRAYRMTQTTHTESPEKNRHLLSPSKLINLSRQRPLSARLIIDMVLQVALVLAVLQVALGQSYDEGFAVKLLDAAAAAYPTNDTIAEICLDKAFNSTFNVLSSATAQCGKKTGDSCKSYMAVSDEMEVFIIGIRGTEGFTQLWDEAKSGLGDSVAMSDYGFSSKSDVRGVSYFLKAANDIYKTLAVEENLGNKPGYKVYVTGHSLGGALAALISKKIVFEGKRAKDQVFLVTFGEPRVGNYKFSVEFKQQVPYSFRVVHGQDPIPHVPTCGDGIDMFTSNCNTAEGWYHHATEVWYYNLTTAMNRGYYRTCDSNNGEDPTCSNSVPALKRFWKDFILNEGKDMHLHYFNHFISEYGMAGCVDTKGASTTKGVHIVALFVFTALVTLLFR
uniref:Lipase_3 domain-containing protein n=1 Tax=Steinernema glaseri TaxID=37863 RepID=A0A1I7YAZ7_9BILA